MRLSLHTVIFCCVFTTVLPLVKGATGELNSSQKKRFKVWLQSRMKRDSGNSLVTANEQYSDIHFGLQQGENDKTVATPLSFGFKSRPRRSASSKPSSCVLGTCVYHDLLHLLHKINNKQRETNAPDKNIGPQGYGRRRRSLQDVTELALQTGRQRRGTEAGQRVPGHQRTRLVA